MKEKFTDLNKKYIYAICLAFVPLLSSMILSMASGCTLTELYLPDSHFNDEVVYYKQTEGIIQYGMPLGFFGYNESHAEIGTCATWSPVLCLAWVIFGKIFSWNLLSPIICNILFMSLSLFAFALISNASKQQCINIGLLYAAFITFSRFCLSGLSDISCFGWLILYLALVFKLKHGRGRGWLISSFVLCFLLVLMRPYFIFLSVILVYSLFKKLKNKWLSILIGILYEVILLLGYMILYKKFSAPYFINLISFDWLKTFFVDGFSIGLQNFCNILENSFKNMIILMKEGVTEGKQQGLWIICTLILVSAIILIMVTKKNLDKWLLFWVFYYILLLFATFFLFDVFNGSKHLLTFVVVGIFVLSMEETARLKYIAVFVALVFFVLFVSNDMTYNTHLPIKEEKTERELLDFQEVATASIVVDKNNDKWDNTALWVLNDTVNGKISTIRWQMLYGLPKGAGINLAQDFWIHENFDNIKSKYLYTIPNGTIAQKCIAEKKKVLYKSKSIILFQLR